MAIKDSLLPDSPQSGPAGRRRTYLIYPQFQVRLIAAQVGIICLVLLAVGIEAYLAFHSLEQRALDANIAPGHAYIKLIHSHAQMIYKHLLYGSMLGSTLSFLVGLFLSHRLAGPIVRLKGYLKHIANSKGPIQPIQFRKGDFFSDLPGAVNEAITQLRSPHADNGKTEKGKKDEAA